MRSAFYQWCKRSYCFFESSSHKIKIIRSDERSPINIPKHGHLICNSKGLNYIKCAIIDQAARKQEVALNEDGVTQEIQSDSLNRSIITFDGKSIEKKTNSTEDYDLESFKTLLKDTLLQAGVNNDDLLYYMDFITKALLSQNCGAGLPGNIFQLLETNNIIGGIFRAQEVGYKVDVQATQGHIHFYFRPQSDVISKNSFLDIVEGPGKSDVIPVAGYGEKKKSLQGLSNWLLHVSIDCTQPIQERILLAQPDVAGDAKLAPSPIAEKILAVHRCEFSYALGNVDKIRKRRADDEQTRKHSAQIQENLANRMFLRI